MPRVTERLEYVRQAMSRIMITTTVVFEKLYNR